MGFRALLHHLTEAEVDFIVVEGVCAVLRGVPTTTVDLDIVHDRNEENRRRLYDVLCSLEACYREHLPRVLAPIPSDLNSDGHMLLMTREGPLDILGTVVGGRKFEDLLPLCETTDMGEGAELRLLNLRTLIRIKEETGRAKDEAQLPLLRAVLRERERAN